MNKMLKVSLYSLMLTASLSLLGSVTQGAKEVIQDTLNGNAMDSVAVRDEEKYADFDVTKFSDGEFPWNVLITTPHGRAHLLAMRTAEKYACCCVNDLHGGMHYIASSLVYNGPNSRGVFTNKMDPMRVREVGMIYILTEAISDIEWVVENYFHKMLSKDKRLWESTRRNDLILLAEILKNDNTSDVKDIQLDELLERLEHTHEGWPSEDSEKLSPLSGYAVIKNALEIRKAQPADTLYDNEISEEWTHEILPSENSADDTEKKVDTNN